MARTLLLQPPLLLHADFIDYPYFANLGLWQAAAGLRAGGHEVSVLDAFCQPGSGLVRESNTFIRLGIPLSGFLGKLPAQRPDAVVIAHSPWMRARAASAELSRLSRHLQQCWPDVPVILADCDIGGMHYIAWDAACLEELGIAFGQQYEADAALTGLVAQLARGERPTQRITLGVPQGDDLDQLPLPAYDLIDMDAYQRFLGRVQGAQHKREIMSLLPPVMALKTSRGCAFRCNFCTSNPWSRKGHSGRMYRVHSAAYLQTHARLLRERYGIERLVILDELVNGEPAHLDAVLDVAEQLDLRLEFPNGMRADRLQQGHIRRLAQRTDTLSVSAESASDHVANTMIGKRIDLDATAHVASWCQDAGLRLCVHWMIGQPGETRAEILQTLKTAWHLYETTGAEPLLQFATPILGTALHAEVTARNLWTTREDRDIGPLFQGKPVLRGIDWTPDELWAAKRILETKVVSWRPRKVILNTTYICNNHCVFCATGNRSDWHGDLAQQTAFLRERREQGYDLCDFDGGEPTTNPNLIKLIAEAKRLGYRQINLTTNGRLLSVPRNAEKLLRSGLTSLLVSLHGPNEDVHERNVQAKGAFAQTLAGIATARPWCDKLGIDFGVNVTLTKTNAPVLLEYGALLVRLGVKLCNVQFLTPFGRASAQCQPDPAQTAPLVMQLIDRYGAKIRFQIINLPMCYLPGYEAWALSDIGKLQRQMVFVSGDDVNLFEYLQSRRRHEKPCETCLYSIACEGFYFWPDAWQDEARARFGD